MEKFYESTKMKRNTDNNCK